MSGKFLPAAIAIVLFILVSFLFRSGTRTLEMAAWVGYGAVLVTVVAAVCRKWTTAPAPRMAAWATAAGHLIAIAAYFLSEFLRAEGFTRVANSFRTLGFEYILISVAYPLRFGGLVVGLGTALILILVGHVSKLRAERMTDQSLSTLRK
jgi:hypothetical protein